MLHISAEKVVRKKDILMIIDLQNPISEQTGEFLTGLEKEGRLFHCRNEKSVVIVTQEDRVNAYYSPISAVTLMKRSNETGSMFENERL